MKSLEEKIASFRTIAVEENTPGFPVLKISNGAASGSVSLYGGHVMSYIPRGRKPVLYLSPAAKIAEGQSLRGGVPVCAPWFGEHPTDKNMPIHGFVRVAMWELAEILEPDENTTVIVLSLPAQNVRKSFYADAFTAHLTITFGTSFSEELAFRNDSARALEITAGLHTYFQIGEIGKTSISGVDGKPVFNKESGHNEVQQGNLRFSGLTTRIYRGLTRAVVEDPVLARRMEVCVRGGDSIVVWNPGPEVEKRFAGFAAGDDLHFVCVEAAIPWGTPRRIQSGETQILGTRISLLD